MSMSRADELRAQAAVAELEEELVRLKGEDSPRLAEVKNELRYARWVARGGPAAELGASQAYEEMVAADPELDTDPLRGISNRAVRDLLARWQSEGER